MKPTHMIKALYAAAVLASIPCFAGEKAGNGGDICEDRFKIVRDDVRPWILKGGSAGLSLPLGTSVSEYNKRMLEQMDAQVSCTDREIFVGGAEKTCKNFKQSNGASQVVCNSKRFMETSQSDQYVLVHHEYAGLSGLETNVGADSKYPISNQISGYLEDELIKKLAIKPTSSSALGSLKFKATRPDNAMQEAVVFTTITGIARLDGLMSYPANGLLEVHVENMKPVPFNPSISTGVGTITMRYTDPGRTHVRGQCVLSIELQAQLSHGKLNLSSNAPSFPTRGSLLDPNWCKAAAYQWINDYPLVPSSQ